MFLSTRDFNGVYEFIIGACKKNCESLLKKKLALLVFKIKKFPSLHYLFFLFYILLSGKIIKRNRCEIKYKNIEIGKFIISFTYYDYECYVNKLKFYKLLIKNFSIFILLRIAIRIAAILLVYVIFRPLFSHLSYPEHRMI